MMHVARAGFLAVLALLILPIAHADQDDCDKALAVFHGAGESGRNFEKAYGYALFPPVRNGSGEGPGWATAPGGPTADALQGARCPGSCSRFVASSQRSGRSGV
jgi:hypothetical protein